MFQYEARKKIEFPGGGGITVTVKSHKPIDEDEYLILKPQAAAEISSCLVTIANALRTPDTPEITLG
ncbi:MAG TPA: hypothetical protein VG297_15800 [Bryobacteraceae bacterium]|nr:hypothetical protein [Bryobacteraceae bacterium]